MRAFLAYFVDVIPERFVGRTDTISISGFWSGRLCLFFTGSGSLIEDFSFTAIFQALILSLIVKKSSWALTGLFSKIIRGISWTIKAFRSLFIDIRCLYGTTGQVIFDTLGKDL